MKAYRKSVVFYFLTAISLSAGISASSQTQQQWAQLVNWDGVSYFAKYINFNAGHMGPNALTVPSLSTGSIDSVTAIGITGQFHFSKGDHTQNPNISGNFCLANNRVSMDVSWIPVEHFTVSDTIKRLRHVYYPFYYDNTAKGDVIVNTNINLLNKWRDKVQLALRIGVRLPSSGYKDVAKARFVDATCYYVDVSAGIPLSKTLKWNSMAGLYVWQQDKDDLRQDDAFLFGTGLEWNKNGWRFQGYCAGYIGYQHGSGDKPIVFRASIEKNYRKAGWLLRLQQGVNDYNYTSVEVGGKWVISSRK